MSTALTAPPFAQSFAPLLAPRRRPALLAALRLSLRRGGLAGLVIGAHLAALALLAARPQALPPPEPPLTVELLAIAPSAPAHESQPQPAAARVASLRRPTAMPRRTSEAPAPRPETTAPPTAHPSNIPTPPQAPTPANLASATATPASASRPTSPAAAEAATESSTPARFDADYLKNPAPAYPPLSRRMGEEGRVMLRVAVTAQGLAEQVEVRTSSGSPRLDDAAVNTVRQWKFIPARRGDTPVGSAVIVPIIFKLEH